MTHNAIMKLGIIILVCLALLFNGCTVIGLAIGSASDKSKPDTVHVAAQDFNGLTPGTKISVHTKDGAVSTGRYKGIEAMNEDAYTARYGNCKKALKDRVWLPALGEEIQLKLAGIDVLFRRQFTGFEPHHMLVQKIDTGEKGMALVDRVDQIEDDDGNVLPGSTLKELMTEGVISYSSQILLQVDMTVTKISVDEVDHVESKNTKYGGIIALFGLVIDILVILSLKNMQIGFDWE